jgi:transcription antitermination factor NusG
MSWFVLQTAPNREFKAAEALRERGYTVYLPAIERDIKASRYIKRSRKKWEPLFNRYVFVHRLIPWREMRYDDPRCLKDRAGRRLLTGLVAVSGAAEPIDEAIIGKIADTVREIERKQKAPAKRLKIGDVGLIKSGPLEGKSGEIVALTKGEAEIAMKIFGAVRTVRARLDALEAA